MATREKAIPLKLKKDAIIEALLEIRFDTATVAEVLLGRIADYPSWNSFEQRQTAASAIPAVIRQADSNLRYQPVFELVEKGGPRSVHVGPQVLSYHRKAPYVGWARFRLELKEAVDCLFEKADTLLVRRLGLRYINGFRPEAHGIACLSDLDLKLVVAGDAVSGNLNVNYTEELFDKTQCTVRVATPGFVKGQLPADTSLIADVDVYTREGFRAKDRSQVELWVEQAHAKEKEQFFRLLKDSTIEELKER